MNARSVAWAIARHTPWAIARHTATGRAAHRLDAPAGCCECGTGGAYSRREHPVTRYVYTGVLIRSDPETGYAVDWVACSEHALAGVSPVVDYGQDVVITHRQVEADISAVTE